MPRSSFATFHCSLARTLDVVGDSWSLLLIRDVQLGIDTFEEIVRDLGISRALLAARLETLVAHGILDRVNYSARPPRSRYLLTEAGRDLVPVLIALTMWGDRWRAPEGPPVVFRHDCGSVLEAHVQCRSCGKQITTDSLTPVAGPGGRSAPGTIVMAERLGAARE